MSAFGAAGGSVVVEVEGRVGIVRLNRPESRNAINAEMRSDLEAAFEALREHGDVRVVVLIGNGRAFCSGVDLKEQEVEPVGPASVLSGRLRSVTSSLDRFPKPVLAAVNGAAYGGGCELALAADMRVCSTTARFCLPEARIGSLPGSGGTQRLARAVPSAIAAKMLFLGEPLEADEAHRYGLVSAVFGPDELFAEAQKIAERVAHNAPLSLLAVKQALAAASPLPALPLERALWVGLAATVDRAEGRRAFREGREPEFEGR